jgi:hypothetical protein
MHDEISNRKDLAEPPFVKNRKGLSVQIDNHRFHGCDSLLDRRNFGNLLFWYRPRASSHLRDDQIATPFFELNEGQSMIFQITGHCRFLPFNGN